MSGDHFTLRVGDFNDVVGWFIEWFSFFRVVIGGDVEIKYKLLFWFVRVCDRNMCETDFKECLYMYRTVLLLFSEME